MEPGVQRIISTCHTLCTHKRMQCMSTLIIVYPSANNFGSMWGDERDTFFDIWWPGHDHYIDFTLIPLALIRMVQLPLVVEEYFISR